MGAIIKGPLRKEVLSKRRAAVVAKSRAESETAIEGDVQYERSGLEGLRS
jgi:hypothetical protein